MYARGTSSVLREVDVVVPHPSERFVTLLEVVGTQELF